jgi:GT2 family glycosyltransferase
VYVGTVTYNSQPELEGCFAALRQQTYPNLQLVVLDNASQDESVKWLQAFAPDIELIQNPVNIGFARAHNQIIRRCKLQLGEFYLALNPDVRLQPQYIEAIIDTLQSNAGIGWATGKLMQLDDDETTGVLYSTGHALRRDGYAINIGYHLQDNDEFAFDRAVFGAPGAAAIYRQELIQAISFEGAFFDEDMFMYGEDVDIDWRAQRQGWQCWYVAQAVAFHRGSQPDEHLRAHALANRYLSVIKNATIIDLICYNLPLMVIHVMVRMTLTPRQGAWIIRQLLMHAPTMWHKRQEPVVKWEEMRRWFQWSKRQPTGQAQTFSGRLRAFFQRKQQASSQT